ncbi:MAG: type IV secretion protein Rhs [Neisseria sp.]|nr:type IV secretion protein Rhs [Neisseria sp.]
MTVIRTLTAAECELVHAVFGDGVDTARVRIYGGVWWLPENGAAFSVGGRIYFPRAHYRDDFAQESPAMQHWFIHEMTHVWQSQQGFPVLVAGVWLCLRGGYWRRRGYRYARHCTLGGFARMNMEQQADAVADYFMDIRLYGQSRLEATLCEFLRRPHGKAVLPRFW